MPKLTSRRARLPARSIASTRNECGPPASAPASSEYVRLIAHDTPVQSCSPKSRRCPSTEISTLRTPLPGAAASPSVAATTSACTPSVSQPPAASAPLRLSAGAVGAAVSTRATSWEGARARSYAATSSTRPPRNAELEPAINRSLADVAKLPVAGCAAISAPLRYKRTVEPSNVAATCCHSFAVRDSDPVVVTEAPDDSQTRNRGRRSDISKTYWPSRPTIVCVPDVASGRTHASSDSPVENESPCWVPAPTRTRPDVPSKPAEPSSPTASAPACPSDTPPSNTPSFAPRLSQAAEPIGSPSRQ